MTRSLLLTAAICCLLLPFAPAATSQSPTDPRYYVNDRLYATDPYYALILAQSMTEELSKEGRFADALAPASQALRYALMQRDTVAIIDAHQGIARLLVRVGRADSARSHAVEALGLSSVPSGRPMYGLSLWVLGEVVEAAGEKDSALALLQAAAGTGVEGRDSLQGGVALGSLGERLLSRGLPTQALARIDSAVALLVNSNQPGIEGDVHAMRGRCLHRLRRYDSACAEFEIAYQLLTENRTRAFTDRARLFVMDMAAVDYFAEWEDSWLSRGSTMSFQYQALGVAERARSQALLDHVVAADTMVSDSAGFLHRILSPGRRFGPGRDAGKDAMEALARSVPPDCALLYYSQLPDSLLIWVYRQGALKSMKTYYPARLYERMQPFWSSISDTALAPAGTAGWWDRHMTAEGGPDQLYRLIAKACFPDTLLALVSGARELIIVPNGWLKQVPFAALPIRGRYLGLRIAIRYAPSVALLEHIESRARPQRPLQQDEILIIGDPETSLGLDSLPGARAEALAVATTFRVKPILGRAATESLVTAMWPRLRVLHVAAHGTAFAQQDLALGSRVYLAPTSRFDGLLTAGEVQERLPAGHCDLVFLSACETAFGAPNRADATVGLPRAFLANGARTVVASLWRLNDASTAFLVRRFYQHLLHDADHPSVARAMHLAMVETSRKWPDPKDWAACQVIGGY